MWTELSTVLKELGVFNVILLGLLKSLLVSGGALAIVFILGRYLEWVHSDLVKNIIGVVAMFFLTVAVMLRFDYIRFLEPKAVISLVDWFSFSFSVFFHFAASIIVYMLICWKLYPRVTLAIEKRWPSRVTRKRHAREKKN